jgi:hypothetical protein
MIFSCPVRLRITGVRFFIFIFYNNNDTLYGIQVISFVCRLLNWIQTKVPDIPISNFTTDWNDGKAVGALVDAVAPGK